MSAALIAYTATVLLLGYAACAAIFAAGFRAGRFVERAKRGA